MSDETIRMHCSMREVPFSNVMDGEWWFYEGAFSVRGHSEEKLPLPRADAKVLVQFPRGLKNLRAFESFEAAKSVATARQINPERN